MKLHFLFSKPHIRAGLTLTLSKENTISFLPTEKKIYDYFFQKKVTLALFARFNDKMTGD